jgi:hypothetical protein
MRPWRRVANGMAQIDTGLQCQLDIRLVDPRSLAQGPVLASDLAEENVGKCRFPEYGKRLL